MDEYFVGAAADPFMQQVYPVREDKRRTFDADGVRGIDKLKQLRSVVPAITHVDYSARIQTVDPERHGRFFKIVESFYAKTGCPVIINTSFNVRGEPIVCTPEDAYRCFMATDMDVLVLENCILLKEEQSEANADREAYLKQFKLD